MIATIGAGRRRRSYFQVFICCTAALLAMGASKTDENEETPTASEKTSSTGYVQLDAGMKNMTKYDGDTLRIKCEITGYPLPRYQWFRNGVLLDAVTSHDGRINVRTTPWGSRLKITKLKVEDSGVYSCSGYNRFGRQTTSGDLSVRQGPNPNRGSGKSDRDPLDLDFDLDGDGFDTDVDLPFRIDPDLDDLDSDGEAEALPGEPSTTQDIARFRQSDDDYDDNDNDDEGGEEEEEDVVGFCQSYRGATCSRFVGNKSIFVRNEYQQGLTEERLTTAFTLLATIPGGLSTSCGEFAIPAMCFDAFPLCDDRVKPPTQRPLCREDCQQLARGPCRREFLTVEASRAQDPKTNAGLPLPDCRHSSASKGSCIRIGVPRLNERETMCYNGTGRDYRGTASRTISGKDCQPWMSVRNPLQPIHINIPPMSDLAGHNFCRNPDQSLGSPWCFTIVGNKTKKEACAVERCSYFSDEEDEGITKILVILVPCVGVVVLVVVLAGVFQIRRKRQTQQTAVVLTGGQQTKVQMSALLKEARNYHELPPSSVVCFEEMGEGRFGRVYRGEFGAARVPVAIQTLLLLPAAAAGPAHQQRKKTQAEFWVELERLSEMAHPNVTGVVGVVCSDVQQVSIVHEFTSTCNLHFYLNTNARVSYLDGLEKRFSLLSPKDLLNIAVQVSTGMDYLSSLGFVHGDLAARSVLISDGGTVKVSSLRYRNSAYGMDYCLPPGPGRCQVLPVRWLPPEAVFHDQFGSTTDAWSFGIVLWEIYSHGSRPFQGHSDDAVIEMLGRHVVLSCPPDCPANVFSLMVDCWHRSPPDRPDFRRIHAVLHRLRPPGETELGATTGQGGGGDWLATFPSAAGHHRTPSVNGNSLSSSGGARQAACTVAPPETVSSTETTEVLVPLVAADPRPHQGAYPVVAPTQQYHVPGGGNAVPSNQTPIYIKRPLGATGSSSSQKSSPPSSLCSGQNRCLHPPTDRPINPNHQDLTTRWMRTMYEDVVI